MPNGELAAALEALERALAEFCAAYDAWLADPAKDGELRAGLDAAERRLDEARQALSHLQEKLRS